MSCDQRRRLSLGEAVALGALQGPTELLPISSSGHTTLIPWLARWPYPGLDPELRKAFEVALHAGAGAALAIVMRGELLETARALDARASAVIAASLAPPALAGYALERAIERRLGGPRATAAGLIAGAVAMALADALPGRATCRERGGAETAGSRRRHDARAADGLALGIAQAIALIPGISRNGATLTAARARGFAREDAAALSWHAALPVILGASALKGWRLTRRHSGTADPLAQGGRVLLAGAAVAFVSTLASARALRRARLSGSSLAPYAIYRCLLAALVLRRLRSAQ
jgi:undecaprenyl-diphosphatase